MNPKPKRQRHFQSLREIEKEMESAHRRIIKFRRMADERDAMADTLFRSSEDIDIEHAKRHRDDAEYMRRKADRLERVRLVKLKHAHAAFQTELLPGVTEDKSVVLEKV